MDNDMETVCIEVRWDCNVGAFLLSAALLGCHVL